MVMLMKRCVSLFLALILLIPCIAVPASASSWTDHDVENVQESLEMIENDIYTWFLQWYDYFFEATETVNDVSGAQALVTPFKYDLIEVQMYVWSWIGSVFDDIKTDVSRLESYVYQIYQYTLRIPDILASGFTNIYEWFGSLVDRVLQLKDSLGSILVSLEDFRTQFATTFQEILHGDSSLPEDFDDDFEPIETQVDEWIEELETAPTFPEDELVNLIGIAGNAQYFFDPVYTAALSSMLSASADFMSILILCFIFAVIGYLLYGKR